MATNTLPTSNEKAPSLMEWDSLSEEDQFGLQEELIKFLRDPKTIQEFSEACRNIGQKAVTIDKDFRTVKNCFSALVEKYGKDFPDVEKVYVPRWDGIIARWNGETGIFWSSRKLAVETVAAFGDYEIALGLVADIKTQDDLKNAQTELKDYAKRHPVHIATEVVNGIKNLRNDLRDFSSDFTDYIDQKQPLSDDAKKYEAQIQKYEGVIAKLNQEFTDFEIVLGCTFPFQILSAMPVDLFGSWFVERDEAQAKIDQAKADLATTIAEQKALPAVQATLDSLKPDMIEICYNLSLFARIWIFATSQSNELNHQLNAGMEVLTRKKFQVSLALLIVQIKPLKEGMRQYSAHITPPLSNVE